MAMATSAIGPPSMSNAMGMATLPVLAPRRILANMDRLAIMVHAMGNNFSDDLAPLGSGGGQAPPELDPAAAKENGRMGYG